MFSVWERENSRKYKSRGLLTELLRTSRGGPISMMEVQMTELKPQSQGPPREKVADIQAIATVDWSPLGEIFVK